MILRSIDNLDELINNDCREHIDTVKYRISNDDRLNSKELLDYINYSKASKKFYEMSDFNELKAFYLHDIQTTTSAFKQLNKKEIMIAYMELIRLSVMYENIGEKASLLSQTGLNASLLGKGVCDSQAKYLCNLLLASNIKAIARKIYEKGHNHTVVIAQLGDKNILLDPTNYDGNKNVFIKGTEVYKMYFGDDELSSLEVNYDEIIFARKITMRHLVKKFKIDELSTKLQLDTLDYDEKVIKIINFIQDNLISKVSDNMETRGVEFNDREFDPGKLIELLFFANQMDYNLIPTGRGKANNYLSLKLFDQDIVMNPQGISENHQYNFLVSVLENGEFSCVNKNLKIMNKIDLVENSLLLKSQFTDPLRKNHIKY